MYKSLMNYHAILRLGTYRNLYWWLPSREHVTHPFALCCDPENG